MKILKKSEAKKVLVLLYFIILFRTALLHLKDRGVKHVRVSEPQKVYDVYEFKEEIGHGSFGVVVLAIEKSNSKHWAIKIVHKNIVTFNQWIFHQSCVEQRN